IPRGGAGPAPVRPDRGRSRSGLLVDDRIQRGATPRQPGRSDARRISPATDRRKFYFRSVCLTGKLTQAPSLVALTLTHSEVLMSNVHEGGSRFAIAGGLFVTGGLAFVAAGALGDQLSFYGVAVAFIGVGVAFIVKAKKAS